MEFPDVYKVRRSLWQVAGSWAQVTITETGGTAFSPLMQRVKCLERSGCEHLLVSKS